MADLDADDPADQGRQDADRPALVPGLRCKTPEQREDTAPGTGESRSVATAAAPIAQRPFEHLVLDFLAYLEFERGLSRNTLEAYRSDLLQYGRFLEERGLAAVDVDAAAAGGLPGRAGGARRAAGLAGHDPPQGRLPALLLPPPAPRGPAGHRPHGQPDRAAAGAQAAPGADPRGGGQAARPAQGHRAHRPARPRAAGADVRVRAAGLRGDRPGGLRRRPGRGRAARAGQGLQGARGARGPDRRRGRAPLPGARPARRWWATPPRRTCS